MSSPEATRNAAYLAGLLVETARREDKSNANPYCDDETVKAIAEAAVVGAQSDAFVITHDHLGRWAKLMATRDNLAGCAARCAKSLLNRNERREIAKRRSLHVTHGLEDVDEGEVVVDVVKAFILEDDPINSSSVAAAIARVMKF